MSLQTSDKFLHEIVSTVASSIELAEVLPAVVRLMSDASGVHGSFVYLLTGALHGDTLRGVFHAGLRSQTPWVAVRSTGKPSPSPPPVELVGTPIWLSLA